MASIKAAIALYDGVTSPLHSMNRAMNIVLNSFESMRSASSNAVDTSSIQQAREELAKAEVALEGIEERINDADNSQNKFNRSMRNGGSAADGLLQKLKSVAIAAASMMGVQKLVGLSDQVTSTSARLSLLVDDGGSVTELEQKIMASAQRSRAGYLDTAAAVAKLGANAGDAFGSNDEIIAFTEQVNKTFAIGGANAQEQSAAMLQLTQAMASGVLRGDELNSIFEQAPGLIQSIADYMDVPIGSIRSLASEGQITADIIKNAMFAAAEDTNAKFEAMPKTWEQVWTGMKNTALDIFRPILDKINELINSEQFNKVIDGILNGLSAIASFAMQVFDVLVGVASVIIDNWSWIEPIIIGIVGAILLWKAATVIMTAVQWALNAAMMASPITWIIMAVAALIGVIAWLSKQVGGFNVLWQYVWTAIQTGCAYALFGIMWGIDKLLSFFETLGIVSQTLWDALVTGIEYAGAGIMFAVQSIVNFIIGALNVIIDAINFAFGWLFGEVGKIDFVTFGDEALAAADEHAQERDVAAQQREADVAYARQLRQENLDKLHGDAQNTWSDGIAEAERLAAENEAANQTPSTEIEDPLSGIYNNTGSIADNTAEMADSLEATSEELKYLREIAERQAINQFTTAEIKVDMTGMENHFSSDMDIDGFVDVFVERVGDELLISAEGVHV